MRTQLLVAVLTQFVCVAPQAHAQGKLPVAQVAKERGEAISKRILEAIPSLPKQITLETAFKQFGITDDTPVDVVGGGSEGPGGLDHAFVFALGEDRSHLLYVEGYSTTEESRRASELGKILVVHVTSLSVTRSGPRDDSDVPTKGVQLYPLWNAGTVVTEKNQGQQAGAGQPATRPESNSESADKPQPESTPRPR